ncbi:MAG: hypothetical protein ACR2QE_08720 [Acidimicrobiales bacterium]
MARANVALARAESGNLPSVCVMSGRPADGFCPLSVSRGWGRSTTVHLPMTTAVFDRWYQRSVLRVRAGLGAGFCLLGAAVTVRFPTVALIFVLVALGLGGAWFYSTWSLPSLTPAVHIDGHRLIISGAHREFADRVVD